MFSRLSTLIDHLQAALWEKPQYTGTSLLLPESISIIVNTSGEHSHSSHLNYTEDSLQFKNRRSYDGLQRTQKTKIMPEATFKRQWIRILGRERNSAAKIANWISPRNNMTAWNSLRFQVFLDYHNECCDIVFLQQKPWKDATALRYQDAKGVLFSNNRRNLIKPKKNCAAFLAPF